MTLNYEIPKEWAAAPREARAYVAGVNMALAWSAPRAEQAERERDEARAALADAHRGICRGDGHDTPAMTAACVVSAFNSARLDHTTDLDEMTARANDAMNERDALKAKLAEAERELLGGRK